MSDPYLSAFTLALGVGRQTNKYLGTVPRRYLVNIFPDWKKLSTFLFPTAAVDVIAVKAEHLF